MASQPIQIDDTVIDIINRASGRGSTNTSTFSVINGLNINGGIPPLPHNTDQQGYVFFTRPSLNLSYDNIRNNRILLFLADKRLTSMGNAIRCMLNPPGFDRAGGLDVSRSGSYGDSYRSTIVDDKSPFIPLLSNTLLTLPGWPDIAPPNYTSTAGIGGQQVSYHDGRNGILQCWDITATFMNMDGDPVTTLLDTWIEYALNVAQGSMSSFVHYILANRVDYNTAIYRMVMDSSKTYVQRLGRTIAYPAMLDIGSRYNYDINQFVNTENNNISMPFRCHGFEHRDPILVREFNFIVEAFNPQMKDANRGTMVKLKGHIKDIAMAKTLFNFKGYPRISDTYELEWYVDKDTYNGIIALVDKAA